MYAPLPPSLTTSCRISPRFLHPHSTMAVSVSLLKIFSTCLTPSSPPTANPKKIGLPTNTALAPSARAFRTSVPRRTPLSSRRVITSRGRKGKGYYGCEECLIMRQDMGEGMQCFNSHLCGLVIGKAKRLREGQSRLGTLVGAGHRQCPEELQ